MFKYQTIVQERLDILSGRNLGYWADPQAGKGVITPDQKEEIKREGEALTEHLEGLSRLIPGKRSMHRPRDGEWARSPTTG